MRIRVKLQPGEGAVPEQGDIWAERTNDAQLIWVRKIEEHLSIPGFIRVQSYYAATRLSVVAELQPILIYENEDRSTRLHIRIVSTEVDMGDALMSWNWRQEPFETEGGGGSPTKTDLLICTYGRYIVNVLQTDSECADRLTTKKALGAVIAALRKIR